MAKKAKTVSFYGQEAGKYFEQYLPSYGKYPANAIRLAMITKRLRETGAKTVLDCGCGSCMPLVLLLQEGFEAEGFDFSGEMVEEGKKILQKAGYPKELAWKADLLSWKPKKNYDAALALGVFPHIKEKDEKTALLNIGNSLKSNGTAFIEFRNSLFAAFTLNRHSLLFYLNDLIMQEKLPKELSQEISDFYSKRLDVAQPQRQEGKINYSDITAKFNNPLVIGKELFEPCGFTLKKIHFYHFHALPPAFEEKHPGLFKELSLAMENPGDWRGYLMASAFVAEAEKK